MERFELYSKEDVDGLLTNRLAMGRQGLEDALQAIVTLCEVVTPQTQESFFAYFVYDETTPVDEQQAESEANTAQARRHCINSSVIWCVDTLIWRMK